MTTLTTIAVCWCLIGAAGGLRFAGPLLGVGGKTACAVVGAVFGPLAFFPNSND